MPIYKADFSDKPAADTIIASISSIIYYPGLFTGGDWLVSMIIKREPYTNNRFYWEIRGATPEYPLIYEAHTYITDRTVGFPVENDIIITDGTGTVTDTAGVLITTAELTIGLGICSDDPRVVTKTWTPVALLGGVLLEGSSVIAPIVTVQCESDLLAVNYASIGLWGRKYYVSVSCLYENVWRLDMRCDVLASFDQDIRSTSGLVERQENDYNPLLADGQISPTLKSKTEAATVISGRPIYTPVTPAVCNTWEVMGEGNITTGRVVPPSSTFFDGVFDPAHGIDERPFVLTAYADTSMAWMDLHAGGGAFYKSTAVTPFMRCYALRYKTITYDPGTGTNITVAGIDGVAEHLNSDDFINAMKKLFSDPAQFVLGARLYPFDLTKFATSYTKTTPHVLTDTPVYVGKYMMDGVSNLPTVRGPLIGMQGRLYVGSVYVTDSPTYLDMAPYKTYNLYLPYYGFMTIPDDLIFGGYSMYKTDEGEVCEGMYGFDVYYTIDFTTGDTLIEFSQKKPFAVYLSDIETVASYKTVLGVDVPLSSTDYSNTLRGGTSTIVSAISGLAGMASGNPAAVWGSVVGMASSFQSMRSQFSHGQIADGSATLASATQLTLLITTTENTSTDGMAAVVGRPLHEVRALSTLSGMTTVSSVILDGIACTDQERELIRSALAGGVIL